MAHLKRDRVMNLLYKNHLNSNLIDSVDKTNEVFSFILKELDIIDSIIENNLTDWSIPRLNLVDRAIIEIATYELKYTDLHPNIIISEALKLTKEYSELDDELQHKFTNKVLDKIKKELRKDDGI